MNDAIFILAPMPRSGTNFLWDLLRIHPQCAAGRSPIWEDYLLKNSPHLFCFVDEVQACWDRGWGPTEDFKPQLLRHLGDGIIRFMSVDPSKRLVLKSPTIENLELFFHVFPDADLILLLRDGRDVVHSGMSTFGWELADAAATWARAVDRIDAFLDSPDVRRERCHVVRYEDLIETPRETMVSLLQALRLSDEDFDHEAAANAPVRGSSQFAGIGSGNTNWGDLHWDPIEKNELFKPTGRWKQWDEKARQTFLRIARPQLERFAYKT